MIEPRHTLGPWRVASDGDRTIIHDDTHLNRHIAYLSDGGVPSEEEGPNARLIATAPDLIRTIRYARLSLWDLVKHLPENSPERKALAMMDGCIGLVAGRVPAEANAA